MIVELIIKALASIMEAIGRMFGTIDVPGWWSNVDDAITTLGSSAAGFAPWLPIDTAITVAQFVMAVLGLGFVIKLVRIVASFFTAGGGSAA